MADDIPVFRLNIMRARYPPALRELRSHLLIGHAPVLLDKARQGGVTNGAAMLPAASVALRCAAYAQYVRSHLVRPSSWRGLWQSLQTTSSEGLLASCCWV